MTMGEYEAILKLRKAGTETLGIASTTQFGMSWKKNTISKKFHMAGVKIS